MRLTIELYERVRDRLLVLGYGEDYEWAQGVGLPNNPEDLVREYVWVVLNSGMKHTIARKIMDRVWPCVVAGGSASTVFGHRGKAAAIDSVWAHRKIHYVNFVGACGRTDSTAENILAWCDSLPWIGPITKYHMAKNLGADVAKPDRWLVRLAAIDGETVAALCSRLAIATGDRIASVDVVLWRACAAGVLVVTEDSVRIAGQKE